MGQLIVVCLGNGAGFIFWCKIFLGFQSVATVIGPIADWFWLFTRQINKVLLCNASCPFLDSIVFYCTVCCYVGHIWSQLILGHFHQLVLKDQLINPIQYWLNSVFMDMLYNIHHIKYLFALPGSISTSFIINKKFCALGWETFYQPTIWNLVKI